MKIASYVGRGDCSWHTFVPKVAQFPIEGFYAAAELDGDTFKLCGKVSQAVAIHIVSFKPQCVDVLVAGNLADECYGLLVEFGGRAGVDDVEHAIVACHLPQHGVVDGIGVGTDIGVVVAEDTLLPTTACTLQKHKFAWKFGMNE